MAYREAREKYKPKPIEVLWIAESPPDAGRYFYFETFTPPGYLFRYTMEALNLVDDTTAFAEGMDKAPLLKRFRDCGNYLVDLSERPVNGRGPRSLRERICSSSVSPNSLPRPLSSRPNES